MSSGPKFVLRAFIVLLAVLALTAIAIALRDSHLAVISIESFSTRLWGSYPPWSAVDAVMNAVFLGGIVVAIIWIAWPRYRFWRITRRDRAAKARSLQKESVVLGNTVDTTLLPDGPLSDSTKDELDRLQFARDIVHTITVAPPASSFVISVEGAWGEGKTTVVHWVGDALAAHPSRPIVVRFDPWPEDSKRGVVARLLDNIASALNARPDLPESAKLEAARLFGQLADAAAKDMPSSYGLIRGIVGWLAYPDKANYRPHRFSGLDVDRESLQRSVSKLTHRLVILVDDLDRVDGEELRTILMAVNALSSFDNTVVVLAFDPHVVDSALAAQGFSAAELGTSFREKIVQVSRPLPRSSFRDRQRLLEKSLQHVLGSLNALACWKSWAPELAQQAILAATGIANTPRSIKRLANHTGLLVSRLQTEVNSPDVLLLELVRAHFSSAWHFIRSNLESFNPRNFDLTTDRSRTTGTPIDGAIKDVPMAAQAICRNVLEMLFPVFAHERLDSSTQREDEAQSRVSVGRNLVKYFHLGVESNDIPDADARAFVYEPSSRSRLAANAAAKSSLGTLFVSAAAQVTQNAVPEVASLCDMLMSAASNEWRDKAIDVTEDATLLIYRALQSIDDEDERNKLLREIVLNPTSISITQSLILDLLQYAQLWDSGVRKKPTTKDAYFEKQLVSTPRLEQLSQIWLQTAWESGVEAMFDKEPVPISNLFRMAQLDDEPAESGYQRVRVALDEYLKSESHLVKFVSQFSPSVRGTNYGISGVEKLLPDWIGFLRRVVALKEPRDAIEKFSEVLEELELKAKSGKNRTK